MTRSSKPLHHPAIYPFKGTAYFLSHPRFWWLQIFAMLVLSIILIGVFALVLFYTWPQMDLGTWHTIWGILKAVGISLSASLVAFIVLMPLLLTLALDKMVRKMYLELNHKEVKVGFFKSMYSSTVIFFRTLFWRIFWPIVGLICAIFLGPLGIFIAQLGIGHLAVIDGVDLALALKGHDTSYRLKCYRERSGQIFLMGFFAAVLSMLLSFTILAWLIWVPGVIAGCALWVNEWAPEAMSSK